MDSIPILTRQVIQRQIRVAESTSLSNKENNNRMILGLYTKIIRLWNDIMQYNFKTLNTLVAHISYKSDLPVKRIFVLRLLGDIVWKGLPDTLVCLRQIVRVFFHLFKSCVGHALIGQIVFTLCCAGGGMKCNSCRAGTYSARFLRYACKNKFL